MAHHLHTKKAIRQSAKRYRSNQTTKARMKTAIKQFVAADTSDVKAKTLAVAHRMIDRAAKKHIIHINAASRKKSQLARAYHEFLKSH